MDLYHEYNKCFLWNELCSGWILPGFHSPIVRSMHVMFVYNGSIFVYIKNNNKQTKTINKCGVTFATLCETVIPVTALFVFQQIAMVFSLGNLLQNIRLRCTTV